MNFQKELINWYQQHKRNLPWRHTADPYVIWLSEIILQQTRVEQGLPYFNKFLENFPTVKSFAEASEEKVLKLWQGLGYYSRGRNMLFAAKQVMDQHEGSFPVRYEQLIKLKGVGDYTAAAISSFSANEAKAVLDGNVFRVLARYFGMEEPINSTRGKKEFSELAQSLIQDQIPSVYNQAVMEFGALHCKPKAPLCGSCPLQLDCYALKNDKVAVLPVKLKKLKIRERWINYFICREGDQLFIKQREAGDVWQQLYDFPQLETPAAPEENWADFTAQVRTLFGNNVEIHTISGIKHLLTHQIIYVHFFALDNYMINFSQLTSIKLVSLERFKQLPHPKVIENFIAKHL